MSKSLQTSELSRKPRQKEITIEIQEEIKETGEEKTSKRTFTNKDISIENNI